MVHKIGDVQHLHVASFPVVHGAGCASKSLKYNKKKKVVIIRIKFIYLIY